MFLFPAEMLLCRDFLCRGYMYGYRTEEKALENEEGAYQKLFFKTGGK